ncbi:exodeoxyribonuclease III [Lactococcus termiticola]|uniref:Exodeoxyribonuclease n=1 Tax=Lactococcus termiticola TaxID=2169526 RepID=A0A2R5HF54_9LACT|nr:exodeoxyribonuclease III [Lactococcus termiticola]GBG96699.1 exodeoxyribonuclease III [Lactococcus termiticola]
MTYTFISWNIDSLNAALTGTSERAALSMAVVDKLAGLKPDVLAIQETKLNDDPKKTDKILGLLSEKFPEYEIVHRISTPPARKGYAGTMMLYKKALPEPVVSFPEISAPDTMDSEGRIVSLEFPDFFVTTVYTPNAGDGLKRLDLRGEWDDAYRAYLEGLDQQKPVFASGDFNAAYQEIDLANPNNNRNNPGFTDQEREKFGLLLKAGFTDSFRHLHGQIEGVYSWFSQRSKMAKINNTGWRIDYWLTSDRVADKVKKSEVLDTGARQDHLPILLEVDL